MFDSDYEDSGGSNLISEILSSATQLGTAEILSNAQRPSTLSPYPAPRASSPFVPNSFSSVTGTMMTWVVVAVLAIAGIFVFKKL